MCADHARAHTHARMRLRASPCLSYRPSSVSVDRSPSVSKSLLLNQTGGLECEQRHRVGKACARAQGGSCRPHSGCMFPSASLFGVYLRPRSLCKRMTKVHPNSPSVVLLRSLLSPEARTAPGMAEHSMLPSTRTLLTLAKMEPSVAPAAAFPDLCFAGDLLTQSSAQGLQASREDGSMFIAWTLKDLRVFAQRTKM